MSAQEYFNEIQSQLGGLTINDMTANNEHTITRPEWQAVVEADYDREWVDYHDVSGWAVTLLWFNVKWIVVNKLDETENEALCEQINDIEQ